MSLFHTHSLTHSLTPFKRSLWRTSISGTRQVPRDDLSSEAHWKWIQELVQLWFGAGCWKGMTATGPLRVGSPFPPVDRHTPVPQLCSVTSGTELNFPPALPSSLPHPLPTLWHTSLESPPHHRRTKTKQQREKHQTFPIATHLSTMSCPHDRGSVTQASNTRNEMVCFFFFHFCYLHRSACQGSSGAKPTIIQIYF